MSPRRNGRTSLHQSSSKGKKKKERVTDEDSHSGSDGGQLPSKSGQAAFWTTEDERSLLEIILTSKAEMGDGHMYQPAFWTDVAKKLPPPVRGKAKTAASCKEKWKRMKSTFEAVDMIATTPGLSYSLEKGVNIAPEGQHVWDDLVKKTKGIAKFKHSGWVHYETMLSLVKSKSTGGPKNASLSVVQAAAQVSHPGPSPSTAPTTSLVSSSNLPPSTPHNFSLPSSSVSSSPGLLPPSVPSSYVSPSVSSIQPSSSVSARVERPGKRKADDDVSAPGQSGSVVSGTSGTSSNSRKQYATQKFQEHSKLRQDFNALNTMFQSNMEMIRSLQAGAQAPRSAPLDAVALQKESAAAERKQQAWRLLLELDQEFLTSKEVVTIFDDFESSGSHVDAYILLASTDGMDDVRRCWLRKRIEDAN